MTGSDTDWSDSTNWRWEATAVPVHGPSIMPFSVPIYFSLKKVGDARVAFFISFSFRSFEKLQSDRSIWQRWTQRQISDVSAHSLPSCTLYHLIHTKSFILHPLVFLICVGLWEAFQLFRCLDYMTVQVPRFCLVSVFWCRYSCLISMGGLRLVKRSALIDFIDSRVHGFCFSSPCWIIDWIANAYE